MEKRYIGKSKEKNILIVDDTEANIDVLVETLGDDYEVSVAMDGETALEDVYLNLPDLILLDIMMPGIDGYEVCRRLKADEKTRDIPIIFITALSEVKDETKGLKLGAVDYITKPINPDIVKARAANHLALQQAREDLKKQNQILQDNLNLLQENINLREEIDRISRHDLKTPLNSIISIPRILLQESSRLAAEQIKLLEIIERSGHTMLNMINMSLDLLKMEKGTYKLQPISFDILGVIKKIIFDLRTTADSKLIKFSIILNGNPVSDKDIFGISGEELLCYSMFANLIKNAVEASPDNGTITISLSKSSKSTNSNLSLNSSESSSLSAPSNPAESSPSELSLSNLSTTPTISQERAESFEQAIIKINNQGVVPASIRDNFFDKYATSGKKGGTGLGTYSAKLMAQTLNGKISMSTSEVEGTTITVELKSALIENPAEIINLTENKTNQTLLSEAASLRIMVVDDDEYNRFIIEHFLKQYGVNVEQADNGQAAFLKFKEKEFDIVFMDMEMPVMDGIEAVHLMRKHESDNNKNPKKAVIIALSGHDDANICQICLDMGFDHYLSKPVGNKKLYDTILKFCADDAADVLISEAGLDIHSDTIDNTNAADNHINNQYLINTYNANIINIDADLEELIPSFMSGKQEDINKISEIINGAENLDADSYNLIQKLGHKIKGGFYMYGFSKQGDIGALIEKAGQEQNLDKIQNNINLLNASLKDIKIRYVLL